MFNFNKTPQDIALDTAIDDLLEELESMHGSDENYGPTSDELIKLMKLKKEMYPSWRPSPDALVGLAGSVLTIVLVLHYEKINVIASKALSFVMKMK